MKLFGSRGEHHETPCPDRDDGGPSHIRRDQQGKPNPMGWGSDVPRTVKRPDARAGSQSSIPRQHGSRMDRVGGLIKQSGDRVRVAGEKPSGRRP